MKSNTENSTIIKSLKNKKIILSSWACKIEFHYQYRDWGSSLKKLFGKLILFSPREQFFQYGKKAMNKNFLKLVQKEKPDYILFSLSYNEFDIDTLIKIREVSPKTVLINYFGDDTSRFDDWSRYYALFFDYMLTSEKDNPLYSKDGIDMKRVIPFQFVNCNFFKPLNIRKKYDVTFMGTPFRDRYDYIKFILKNKINFYLIGTAWHSYADLESIRGDDLNSEDYTKLANQTKINLSFSKTAIKQKGKLDTEFKGRILEIPATRSFILIEKFSGSNKFSKTFQKVIFKDKLDLIKKIKYYLKHEKEREEIAKKLYTEVKRDYDLDKCFINFFIKEANLKLPKPRLPELNEKTVILEKEDFNLSNIKIKNKLKDVNYIGFSTNNLKKNSKIRYFQKYSLKKSKKEISCCDYYVNSKILGDYMLFKTKEAFKTNPKAEFDKFVRLDQLMVKKNYFIKNINLFRSFVNGEVIDLINDINTVFVSIPLIRINNLDIRQYSLLSPFFRFNFLDEIYSMVLKKRPSRYLFKLLIASLFGKKFIFKAIKQSVFNKVNISMIKNY